MSMKRAKQRTSGPEKDSETDFWAKKPEPEKTWDEAVTGQPDDAFKAYAMSVSFSKGELITHTKFGKGVITAVEAGRVEILFESGKKKLGHGQS